MTLQQCLLADLKTLSLPASTVQRCVEVSEELIDDIICSIEEVVSPILEDTSDNIVSSQERIQNAQSVLQTMREPFSKVSSEYQQIQYALQRGALVQSREIVLGQVHRAKLNRTTGRTEQKQVEDSFQYIPIRDNLTHILERPGCMSL